MSKEKKLSDMKYYKRIDDEKQIKITYYIDKCSPDSCMYCMPYCYKSDNRCTLYNKDIKKSMLKNRKFPKFCKLENLE